jgi:TonB family protein
MRVFVRLLMILGAAGTMSVAIAGGSSPTETPKQNWSFSVTHDDTPRPCRFPHTTECTAVGIEVDNASSQILDCDATIDLDGINNEGVARTGMGGMVLPRTRRLLLKTLLPPNTTIKSGVATCVSRAPLPPLATPKGCSAQVLQAVNMADYYPAVAIRLGESGPVVLQFVLQAEEGHPSDIRVVGSSLSARLDEAAIKALGDMVLKTTCVGNEFRIIVSFELRD